VSSGQRCASGRFTDDTLERFREPGSDSIRTDKAPDLRLTWFSQLFAVGAGLATLFWGNRVHARFLLMRTRELGPSPIRAASAKTNNAPSSSAPKMGSLLNGGWLLPKRASTNPNGLIREDERMLNRQVL
jgi:hypothetical protein